MKPIQLFDPASSTYTYVLFDETSRNAVLIDPVDVQLERDLATLAEHGLKLLFTLETHAHADHATRATALQLKDGDTLSFGNEHLLALHTPGHTAGSMSYRWRDHVFTGDTLLIDGCGRTDFQSGSTQALQHSLTQILFALPESTTVWPGHYYHGRTHSTIGTEKARNARVVGKTLVEFTTTLNALDLPKPGRIDEMVPANLSSGRRHDAGGDTPLAARPAQGYAGDVSPQLACQWWQAGEAVLVDVRTDAERDWVGLVPGAVPLAWKQWPGMVMNPAFDEALRAAVAAGQKAVLLCRSGVRSIAAAKRATELGFEAYNILEGFEGDPDTHGQRGRLGGWRFHGLPWRQG